MTFSGFTKRLHKSQKKAGNKDTAHSQGPSSDDASTRDCSSSSRPSSTPPSVTPAVPPAMDLNQDSCVVPPSVLMPVPDPLLISMSVPEPSAPTPTGKPSRAMDDALAQLAPLHSHIEHPRTPQKIERALESMEGKVAGVAERLVPTVVLVQDAAQAVAALEATEIAQKIERGIQRFAENIPWLMKSLDEVSKIHPAVTAVVLAFKAIYYLESTRQENDRRVMILYVDMKDMMLIIVQLKDVESRTHIGLDGTVLEDRLETLAKQTADDIKACANFCDTFLKKRLLAKVFKGPLWADKLTEFSKTFAQRKNDFEFALTMHTANSLTDIKEQNFRIDAKLDAVMQLFNKFISAEERRITSEIDANGGQSKVRKDDAVLKSLIALDISITSNRAAAEDGDVLNDPSTRAPHDGKSSRGQRTRLTLEDLKAELKEDIDDALERNFDTFSGKFALRVEQYIRAENDRVIGVVTDAIAQGPHTRVKDPILRRVWHDMNWRGSVKARVFVMSLQEFFRELFDLAAPGISDSDQWALEYLGVSWLQPLMDAFDEDASGYVTIAEVNRLMDTRPSELTWSIPHWMAYWAIGWRLVGHTYVTKILKLLSWIRDTIPKVLPRNRIAVDRYFDIWWQVMQFIQGFEDNGAALENDLLLDRFQPFLQYQEDHFRRNLEKIKYRIDASDTLSLVVGQGPLEKYFFPLVYLMLEHDWRKVQAAKSVVLADYEMEDSYSSFLQVFGAATRRREELAALFEHQKLDLDAQFGRFAYGMFHYVAAPRKFWTLDNQHNALFTYYEPLDETEPTLDGIGRVTGGLPLDTRLYDHFEEDTEADLVSPLPLRAILGQWSAFMYTSETYPQRPMLSLYFHYSDQDGEDFTASGIEFDGDAFKVSGTYTAVEGGLPEVKWIIQYDGELKVYYTGHLVDEYTVVGTRAYATPDDYDWSFVMKKIPEEYMIFRPPPMVLESEDRSAKYRALWKYAMTATIDDVRRRWWTWSFFAARRDTRNTYLTMERERIAPRNHDLTPDLVRNRNACTLRDVVFYESLALYRNSHDLWSTSDTCACRDPDEHSVRGSQNVCLECTRMDTFWLTVTLCDAPACLAAKLTEGLYTHYPTHDYVRLRTAVFPLQWPTLVTTAREALEKMRESPKNRPPERPHPVKESAPDTESTDHGEEEGTLSEGPAEGVRGHVKDENLSAGDVKLEAVPPVTQQSPPPDVPSPILGDPVDPGSPANVSAQDTPMDHTDDTPPKSPAGEERQEPAYPQTWACIVCMEKVYYGESWYCLDCSGYLCFECESKTLIACAACPRRFTQPEWFYGGPSDDFLCPTCCGKGAKSPESFGPRHAYIHPTVLCRPREDDPPVDAQNGTAEEDTLESRLARVEARVTAMDEKFERLQGQFTQMEEQLKKLGDLETRLTTTQQEMQQALISRISDILVRSLSVAENFEGNGHL